MEHTLDSSFPLSDQSSTVVRLRGAVPLLGDAAEYNRACDDLIARFEDSPVPQVCERVGRASLLRPASKERVGTANAIIDRAARGGFCRRRSSGPGRHFIFAKALAEYRMERFESAISLLGGEATKHSAQPNSTRVTSMRCSANPCPSPGSIKKAADHRLCLGNHVSRFIDIGEFPAPVDEPHPIDGMVLHDFVPSRSVTDAPPCAEYGTCLWP
jgi:hypothetical protein